MNKVVVVLSGGLDSTTLLYDVKRNKEVYALSFDYGQRHTKELEMAKATCKKLKVNHKVINLNFFKDISNSVLTNDKEEIPFGNYDEENMKKTVVPNRNMILLSIATAYAITKGATEVYYGAHAGDHTLYPDCKKEFIEQMKKAIELSDWNKVELKAPYYNITKGDIVKKGIELGVDYSLTWSCYVGREKPCGKCGTCLERIDAFTEALCKDVVEYEGD